MGNIQTVGPNEALIVSGGFCRPGKKQIIVAGWCWTTWMLTNIQRISLQVMTVNPKVEHVQSCHGVPVTLTGVVHCKIVSKPEFLPLAAEQFLGKSVDHIKSVVLHTVEGHMRAVVGTQTVEEICKQRHGLADMIREATTKDLSRMGIDIMSLTIKDIRDDVEYLSSAGKRTASHVKRDAAVTAARAESDAAQVEAGCSREKQERELHNKSLLAKQQHEMEVARSLHNQNVSKIKAQATKAFDLQMACLQKDLRTVEMEVKAIEYDGLIKIKTAENEKHKTELEMEFDLPTRFEIYELNKQTEAQQAKLRAEMESEEYRLRVEGKARAEAARIEGVAEADGMKLVAEARKEFNEAAVLNEVIKVLPKIAAEIASPLGRFEEIVLVSDGSKETNSTNEKQVPKSMASFVADAAKFSSAVPLAVKAVGGSDRQSNSFLSSIMQMQKSAS